MSSGHIAHLCTKSRTVVTVDFASVVCLILLCGVSVRTIRPVANNVTTASCSSEEAHCLIMGKCLRIHFLSLVNPSIHFQLLCEPFYIKLHSMWYYKVFNLTCWIIPELRFIQKPEAKMHSHILAKAVMRVLTHETIHDDLFRPVCLCLCPPAHPVLCCPCAVALPRANHNSLDLFNYTSEPQSQKSCTAWRPLKLFSNQNRKWHHPPSSAPAATTITKRKEKKGIIFPGPVGSAE